MARRRNDRRSWGVGLTLILLLVLITVGGLVSFEAARGARPTAIDQSQAIPRQLDVAEPGRLILDVHGIELAIEPGPEGGPVRIEGNFNGAGYRWSPEYSTYGDRGWIYRLRLRPTGLLGRVAPGPGSSLRITLPRDAPISLEGFVRGGETRIELGGLWIIDTLLDFRLGDHRIAFSQPLLRPMGRLHLDAPMGELTLVKLGNASPVEIRVDKNVGDACIDLRGAWQSDSSFEIACGVASCDLHRPGDGDAVVALAGSDSVENDDLPRIEIHLAGLLDNVEISAGLRETQATGNQE